MVRRGWNFAEGGKPDVIIQKLYRSEAPRKDRHRSPRSEPVAAQGQTDKGIVEGVEEEAVPVMVTKEFVLASC